MEINCLTFEKEKPMKVIQPLYTEEEKNDRRKPIKNSFRNTLHKLRIFALSVQSQHNSFDLRTYIFRNPRFTNYKSLIVILKKSLLFQTYFA